MRKVVYGGAMSLDGFIAGPNGEYDWIVMDPDIDFAALMARFDTFLIGRKTFEMMRRMGGAAPPRQASAASSSRERCGPRTVRSATLSADAEASSPICARSPARTSRSSAAASCSGASWPRDSWTRSRSR